MLNEEKVILKIKFASHGSGLNNDVALNVFTQFYIKSIRLQVVTKI